MKNLIVMCLLVVTGFGGMSALASSDQASADATLVIYRTIHTNKTRAVNYQITVNEDEVGKLKAKSVFKLPLAAGQYVVKASDEDRNEIVVDLKAGETVYLSGSVDRRRNMNFEVTTPDSKTLAKIGN